MGVILLLLMSIYISAANGGAKYFKSPQFRSMIDSILNKPGGCRAPFVDRGIPFVGNKLFRRIYGVRAFYTLKCKEDCHMPVIKKIRCPKSSIRGGGDRPDQITASCICIARQKKKRKCSTRSYSWSQMEAAHRQYCPAAYSTVTESSTTTTKTSSTTTTTTPTTATTTQKVTKTSEPQTTKAIMTTATQTTGVISTKFTTRTEKSTTYTGSGMGSTQALLKLRDMPIGRRDNSTKVIGLVTTLRSMQNNKPMGKQIVTNIATATGSQQIIGRSTSINVGSISSSEKRSTMFSGPVMTTTASNGKPSSSLQSTNQVTSRSVSRLEEHSTASNSTSLKGTSVTAFSTTKLPSNSIGSFHYSSRQHTKFPTTRITERLLTAKFENATTEPIKRINVTDTPNTPAVSQNNMSSQSTVAFTPTVTFVNAGTSGPMTSWLQQSSRQLLIALANSEQEKSTTVSHQPGSELGKVTSTNYATDASAGTGKQGGTQSILVPVKTREIEIENTSQQSSGKIITVSFASLPSSTVIGLNQSIFERTTGAATQSAVSLTGQSVFTSGQHTTVFVTKPKQQNVTDRRQGSESRITTPATVSAIKTQITDKTISFEATIPVIQTTAYQTLTSNVKLIGRKLALSPRITDKSKTMTSSFLQSADQILASSPTRIEEKSTISSLKQLHIKSGVESTSTKQWTHSEMTANPWISKQVIYSSISTPRKRITTNLLTLISESNMPFSQRTFTTITEPTGNITVKSNETTSSTELKSPTVSLASRESKPVQTVTRTLSTSIPNEEIKNDTNRTSLKTPAITKKQVLSSSSPISKEQITINNISSEGHKTNRYKITVEYVTIDAPMHASEPITDGLKNSSTMIQPISVTAGAMGKTITVNSQPHLSTNTVRGRASSDTTILETDQRSNQSSEKTINYSTTERKRTSSLNEIQRSSSSVFYTTQTSNTASSSSQWTVGERFSTRALSQNITDGILPAIYKPLSNQPVTITASKASSFDMLSKKFKHSQSASGITEMQTMNSTISDKRPVTVSSIKTDEKSTPHESQQRISGHEESSIANPTISNFVFSVGGMTELVATHYLSSATASTQQISTSQLTYLPITELTEKSSTSKNRKTSIGRNTSNVTTINAHHRSIEPFIGFTSITGEMSAIIRANSSPMTSTNKQKVKTAKTEIGQITTPAMRGGAHTAALYNTHSPSIYASITATSDSKEVSTTAGAKVQDITASSQLKWRSGAGKLSAYTHESNASKSRKVQSSVKHITYLDTRAERKHTGSARLIQSGSSSTKFVSGIHSTLTSLVRQTNSQNAATFLMGTSAFIKRQAPTLVTTILTGVPIQLIISQGTSVSVTNNLSLTSMNLQNSKTTSMKSTIPTSSFPVLDNRSGTILPANGKFTPSNKRRLYSEPGMIMASDEGRSHLAGSSQQWTKRIKFSTKNYSKLIINYSPSSKMNTLASSLLAAPLEASSTAGITANAMANNNVSIDSKLRETTTNGNVANNQTRDTQQSGRQTENRYTSTAKNNVQITISKPVITKVTEPLNSGTATSLTKSLESSISTVQMTSYSSTSAKSISTSFSGHFENETNAASYRLKISTLPTRSVKKLNSQDKTPTASSSRQWKNSNVKTYSDQATFASNLRQSDSGQMHFTTTIIQGRHTRNLFESLIAKNIATFSETLTTDKPGRSFSAYNGTQYKPVYTTKIQNISTTNAFQQLSRETPPMPDTGGSQNWASQQTKPRATRITESRPIVGLTTTPSNHAFAFDPFTAASVVTTKDTSLSILNQAKPLHIQTLFSRKNIEATTANNPSAQSITKVGASTVQTFVGGASTFQTSEMHNSQTSTRLSTILAHESRISFPVQTVTTLASEQKTSVATKETVKQTMSGNQEMDGKSVSISSVSSRPSRKITGLDGLINEVSITSTSTKTSNNSRGRMNNSLEMRSTIPYTTMRVSQNTSERQLLSDSDLPHITASTDTLSSLTPKMQTLTNKPMGIITKTITEKNTSWSEQLILESTASSSSVGTPNGQNRIASVVRFANGDRTTMHEKSMATSTKATVSTLVDNKSTLKTGSDHLTNKVIGPNAGSTKMTTVGSFLQSISVLMNRSTIAGGYYGQTNTVLNNETFPTSAAISETTTQTEGPRQGSYHAATISVAQQPSTTSLQKPIDQLLTSSPTNSSTSPLSRNKQPPSSHFVSASTIKILKLTTSSNEQQFSSRYMASSTSHESGIVLTDARKEGQRTSIKQLVGLLYTATPSTRHEINTPTISVKPPYSLHSTLTASMTSAPQPISNKLSPNLRKSENQSTAAYFTAASLKYTTGRQEQASTDIFNTSTKKQAISFLQSIGQYMNVSTTVKEGDDGRSLTSQQLSSRIDSISVTDAFLDTTVTKQNITISTKALSTKVVQNSNAKDQSGDENTTAIMNHEPIISSASQKQSSTEHSTFIDSQYINITNVTLSFKVGTSSGTNNMHNHLSTQRMTNSSSKILLNGTRGSTQSYNGTYTVFPQDKKVTATATNSQYQTKDFSKTATELKSSSKIGTAAPAHENVTLAAESSSIGKMDSSSQTMKRSTRSIFDEQQVNNKVKTFSVNGSVAPTTARIQLSHHMPSPSTTKIGSIRPPSNTQKSESSSVPTSIQNRKANTTIQRSSENAVTSTEIPQKTTTVSLHIMKKETNTAATSYGVPNLSSNYRTRMNVFTASVGGIKNDVQNLSSKPVKMTTLEILTQSSQQSRSQQVAMLSTGVTATDKVISSKRATYRPVILSSLENAFTTSTNLYKQSDTKHSGYDATSSMLGNIFRSRYQSTTAILTAEVNHTAAILETKSTQQYATDIPTDAQGRRINSTQIESASSTESNSKQKVTSSSGAIWKKSTSITEPQENVTVQEPSKTERAPTSSLVLFSSSTMKNRDLTKGKIVSSRTISDGKNEPAISLQPSSNKISTVSTVGHSRNAATSTTQAVINSTSIYSKNNTSTNYTQHLTRLQATTLSAKTISLQQLIGQRVADFIVIDTSKTVKPGTEILGTTYLFSGVTKIIMKSRASTQRNFESNVVTSNRSRSATTGVLGIENRTVSTAALENTLNSLMNVDPLISHTTEASSIRQQSKNQETSVVAGKTTNVGRKSREAQTMIKTVPSSDSTVVADTSVSLHNISRNSSTTKMENTSSISTRMTKSIFEPSVSDSASVVLEKSTKRFSNQFTPLSTTRIENNSNRMINSIGGAGATEIGMRTSTGSNLWSKSEHTSNPATIWSIKSTAIDAQESNSIHITTTSNKDQSNITTTQEVSKLQSCSQQFWTTATPTTAINGSASTPLQESSGGITETSTIGETRIGMMDDKLQNITIVLSSYASDISTTDFQVWSTSAATVPITVSANENSTGMNSHRQHMNGNDTFLLLTSRPATYFNDHYFQLDDDEVKNMNKSNETLR